MSSTLTGRLYHAKMTHISRHFRLINRTTFRGTASFIPSSSPAGNEFAKEPEVPRTSLLSMPISLSRPLATWPCTRIHSPRAQSYHVQSRSYSNTIVQSTASYRTVSEHSPGLGKISLIGVSPSAINTCGFLHNFPNVSSNVFQHYSSSSEGAEGITEKEMKREMEELTDQFMETRELLADAMESKGSVYFDEDLLEAKQSLDETLERYRTLLSKLSEEQERAVVRTIGLKMDELKAQEAMIMEELKED